MTDKDMYLVGEYFNEKSNAAFLFAYAIGECDNLEESLSALFEWQFRIDEQLRIWNQMKDTKRIEGIMIASGFTG